MTEGEVPRDRASRAPFQSKDFSAFVRYAVVGVTNNLGFYGLTLVLLYLRFTAWQATAILFPVAVALSFLLNRSWSFTGRTRAPAEFRKYLVVYTVAYPVAITMTWAQERVGVPSWLASLATLAVAAVGIFLALDGWVFRKASTDEIH